MPGSVQLPGAKPTPGTVLGLALGYVVLGLGGRATIVDGTTFALIWPAAGVAVLWFLVRGARAVSVDTALLALCTYAVNALTGAPPEIGLLLVVTNLLQTLVVVDLVRRWCPGLWGGGGARPLDAPLVLARYLAAAVLGTLLGALVGTIGIAALHGRLDGVGGALWFGRNLCGVLTITTLGLLAGQWLAGPRPRTPLVDPRPVGRAELAAALVFTAAVYSLAFALDDLPLAFPLLGATVWVGLRFPTLLGAAHSALVGAATVTLTLVGVGPFADVANPAVGALLAQSYVALVVVTALVLGTGRDERHALATELRRTEAAAVYEASLRDAIIGSMAEGLLVTDEAGEVLVRNRAAGEILDRVGIGSVGSSLPPVGATHSDGAPVHDHERPSYRALHGETVRDLELSVTLPGGDRRIVAVTAAPLPRDEALGRARALVLCRDVTAEHTHREELSSFAGVVAHDLRNPLAAIDGWTQMIAEELDAGELSPELAGEFVARVRSASARMRDLIQDLLDHATSGSRRLSRGRVDVAALVAEVSAARDAEGLVTCGRIPVAAGDAGLVRQLVDNLVGNALKYVVPGEEPRVEVTGRVRGDLVTVCVADHGIGLPDGEHDRVFEEFHRAHPRGYEGSGLGLAICRRIVTRHGGTILARDNPAGRGTVFEFSLPAYVRPVGVDEDSEPIRRGGAERGAHAG
jgi:signal transduction histidine kinase